MTAEVTATYIFPWTAGEALASDLNRLCRGGALAAIGEHGRVMEYVRLEDGDFIYDDKPNRIVCVATGRKFLFEKGKVAQIQALTSGADVVCHVPASEGLDFVCWEATELSIAIRLDAWDATLAEERPIHSRVNSIGVGPDDIVYRCECCDIELWDGAQSSMYGITCHRCAKGITNEERRIRMKMHIQKWNPKLYKEKYGTLHSTLKGLGK